MNQIPYLMNLPTRDADGDLKDEIKAQLCGTGKETSIQLYCGSWKITRDNIVLRHEKDLADTIAHLIMLAMDAGFEQGRQHIRRALGVK